MQNPTYVYPNVSRRRTQAEPPRGGLLERWVSAKECSCKYIEVPGNFLKKNEVIPTLNVGDILTKEAIMELYQKDSSLPSELRYILHTDPELEPHHKLDWHKAAWRKQFVEMINDISLYFEVEPNIIEIHPSVGIKNPFAAIVEGITSILDSFQQTTKSKPLVLLENRTCKQISNGKEILEFFKNIEKTVTFIKETDNVERKAQEIVTRINSNMPKTYIIFSSVSAISKCGKIKRLVVSQISGYNVDLFKTDAKEVYFLNKVA